MLVWLIAIFSHSLHSATLSQLDAQTECHLCHNNIDNTKDVKLVEPISRMARLVLVEQPSSQHYQQTAFITPYLRAPPAINT